MRTKVWLPDQECCGLARALSMCPGRTATGPRGRDEMRVGGKTVVPGSAAAPSSDGPWAVRQLRSTQGWSLGSKHRPQRPDRREAAGRAGVEGLSSTGVPRGQGNQDSSLLVSQSASSGRPPTDPHP